MDDLRSNGDKTPGGDQAPEPANPENLVRQGPRFSFLSAPSSPGNPKASLIGSWDFDYRSEKFTWKDEVGGVVIREDTESGMPEELFRQYLHPEDCEPMMKSLMDAIGERTSFYHEYRIVYPDGTIHDMISEGHPVIDAGGETLQLKGRSYDVTELRLAERIRQSLGETKFRELVEGSIQGILIHRRGRPLFINQSFADIHGYGSFEELMALPSVAVLLNPETVDRMIELETELLAGHAESQHFEMPSLKKDGSVIWNENLMRVVDWEGGRAIQSTVIDITERKNALEALRKSQENLARAQKFANMGNWEWNLPNDRMEGSEEAHRIIAQGEGPYVGSSKDFFSYVAPEDRERLMAAILKTIKNGIPFDVEYRAIRPDGEVRDLQAYGEILKRDPQGNVLTMFGTTHDITDRLRIEQQLRQSQKMEAIGHLAGGMAHEFNNLLQVIMGYASFGLEELPAEHEQYQNFAQIQEASERGARLIENLLGFSRKKLLKTTMLDPNQLIRSLLTLMEPTIGENFQIDFQPEPDIQTILADESSLQQMLMNLLLNARDAQPKGGRIIVETGNETFDADFCAQNSWASIGSFLRISVADEGIGMNHEDMRRMFDPFFTTKAQGTGLGLSWVYGMIRQHYGFTHVSSTPDTGTCVTLYFPLHDQERVGETSRKTRPRKTILLAEDEYVVKRFITQILENLDYRVLSAADGEKAIQIFNDHVDEIDLAILDMIMPKLGGREVYQHIRALKPHLPVIFQTGYDLDKKDAEFVTGEHAKLLNKPFLPNDLRKAVTDMI